MPLGATPADVPRIRTVLAIFRVSAVITGIFLIGLVAMMITRYGFGVDIELGGPFGFLALTPVGQVTAINLSVVLLSVHGWLYVLYLALDFILWRMLRFSFLRFLWFALGGVIPFLSFWFEVEVPRFVKAEIRKIEARAGVGSEAVA